MAVDAKILIKARIREETAAGAGARKALDVGFDKAYATIVDGNMTTMVGMLLLLMFGSGPVRAQKGFLALGLAMLAILAYIWWRLEWHFAVGAIATLLLDYTKMIGCFALMQISLLAMAIWGGDTVRPFAWPMLFGVVVATTLSIYIGGPILRFLSRWWKEREGDRLEASNGEVGGAGTAR